MIKSCRLEKWTETYLYLVIAIILTLSLIKKGGHMFLLDIVPIDRNLYFSYNTDILDGGILLFITMSLIPSEVLFFLVLVLSGYSMHKLVGVIQSRLAQYYAGILYMINPFMYVRILAGHWYLLFTYAILPLLIKTFIELLENSNKKNMIKFVILTSLVAFATHMLIIALIIMSIIFIFWLIKYRYIRNIKVISIAIIIFILLNFYWIFPLITAKNTMIDNIGNEDFKVFSPKIDDLSDLFNIASMYGFWREGYIYAKDFIPYWQLLSILIISLAIYGFISYCRDEKIGYMVKALGVIGIIGFILATGINGPFGDINHWLYDNTILKGFRDSHKFVAMIVLTYAILGGLGVSKIVNIMDDKSKENL